MTMEHAPVSAGYDRGMWVWDAASQTWAAPFGNAHGGMSVVTQMPSKAPGRSKVTIASVLTTVGALLYTVPADYELHVVDMIMSGINISTTASTRINLRDGLNATGVLRYVSLHSQASVGSPHDFEDSHSWQEHPIYRTGVFVELALGTITIAVNLEGYLAPVHV